MRKETESERQSRLHLHQDYVESGQSIKAYCTERGLTYWRTKHAIKKTAAESEPGGNFQEVALPKVIQSNAGYVLRLRSGHALEIPALFNEKRVRQLVEVLEQC